MDCAASICGVWGVNPVCGKESAREEEFWPGKNLRALVNDSLFMGRLKMTVSRARE